MTTWHIMREEAEEAANAATHAVAALVAAAATAFFCFKAAGDALAVVSVSVFCASMVLLFAASAIYHALSKARIAGWLQALDHVSIYLLIAGTYAPFSLVGIGGWIGWALFGFVTGLATVGILGRLAAPRLSRRLALPLYLLMGWSAVVAIDPLVRAIGVEGFAWVFSGGSAYTVGALFYVQKKRAWMHLLWHLFVVAGAAFHGVGVLYLLSA